MFFRLLFFMFSVLLLFFPCSNKLRAQTTTTGGFTGVVSDPSHAVVPDAVVEIRDNSKGTVQSAKTDSYGVYRFFFLAPGRYALTVTHDGFRAESRELNVLLGPPVTVNFTLKLAGKSSTVKVTGEAPLIQAENGDVSTTMNQQQISEVPNPGNDLTYIAQTAPGAIMNTDSIGLGGSGNFSILGMPGTSNLFTLNGMNDNNSIEHHVNGDSIITSNNNSGVLGMMLGQNEIQEATVVSDGYSGQFGGAAGSNVNYLTKSGSNSYHGNAQYYWNGTVLNANDWFDNEFQNPRPFNIAHQWAGSLGGPIKKDKLFFFFDTEGVRLILPVTFIVTLPSSLFESQTLKNIDNIFGPTSASDTFYRQMFNLLNSTPGASAATPGDFASSLGCGNTWKDPTDPNNPNRLGATAACAVHFLRNASAPSNDAITSGRVDWNMRTNDRVFLLLQFGDGKTPVHVDAVSSLFNSYCNQSTWQGQLNETHTISTNAANQFLLAGTYNNRTCSVANSAQTLAAFPTEIGSSGSDVGFGWVGGFDVHYALPIGSRTTTYQISDDLVKTRGRHKFALGVNFLRTDATLGGYNRYGIGLLSPTSVSAFFCGGVSPSQDPAKISLSQPCKVDQAHPVQYFTSLQQAFPLSTWNYFAFYSLGFYGQEEWHASSNLTLTVALRADHQSNPVCENRCFARFSGPFNSLSHDPNQPYDSGILAHQRQAFPNTDAIVWSPRFSFAWQPLGVSHNSVIRGGVGFFYDPVPASLAADLAYNPPSSTSFNITGYNLTPGETNSLFQNAVNSNAAFANGFANHQTLAQIKAADPSFIPPSFQNPATRMHSAQYQKWSLQAQQSFGASTSLTVGYFGNRGIHELVQNPNANAFGFGTLPSAVCTTPLVLPCADPRFGGVTEFQTNAISNYNGMVVSVEQRFSRWGSGMFQVNYTYGHALDEVSNGGLSPFTTAESIFPQDANNLRGSYGAAEYDARHSLTGNFVWEVPFKQALRGHAPDFLAKGWQVSGTILAHTGNPYTVLDPMKAGSLSANNFFGPIYSVPVAPLGPSGPCGKGAAFTVPPAPAPPVPCLPPQVLSDGSTPNPSALYVQAGCETGFNTGTLGSFPSCIGGTTVSFAQGRNRFRAPAFVNLDFAVMKNTKIPRWENGTLAIGAQFFNFFNHPNFGFPDNWSSDGSFGQIGSLEQSPTSILGSTLQANVARRMIQLKAQLRF
jgi:Carboxypeptidase regulatory-like domain